GGQPARQEAAQRRGHSQGSGLALGAWWWLMAGIAAAAVAFTGIVGVRPEAAPSAPPREVAVSATPSSSPLPAGCPLSLDRARAASLARRVGPRDARPGSRETRLPGGATGHDAPGGDAAAQPCMDVSGASNPRPPR
ncbi:unnamed protein product, partial [Prorocentrum cordatum]